MEIARIRPVSDRWITPTNLYRNPLQRSKRSDDNESFSSLKRVGYEIKRSLVEKLGSLVRFTPSRLNPASSPGVGI